MKITTEIKTLYFCYDPNSVNYDYGYGPDTIYGEEVEVIDTAEFNAILYKNDLVGLKAQVFNGLPAGNVKFLKGRMPLSMKWDRTLFYDTVLLQIPLANQLPFPLFQINMFCGDFNPNYNI